MLHVSLKTESRIKPARAAGAAKTHTSISHYRLERRRERLNHRGAPYLVFRPAGEAKSINAREMLMFYDTKYIPFTLVLIVIIEEKNKFFKYSMHICFYTPFHTTQQIVKKVKHVCINK